MEGPAQLLTSVPVIWGGQAISVKQVRVDQNPHVCFLACAQPKYCTHSACTFYVLYVIVTHSTIVLPDIDCSDPGTPTNGQHSLSSTTYNSVVTYTCDVGYTLQGANSRTCQSNGQWSGSVPQCQRMFLACILYCNN